MDTDRRGSLQFDDYLKLLQDFRAANKVDPPTPQEIAEWRADWDSWSAKVRRREMNAVEDHAIIAGAARETAKPKKSNERIKRVYKVEVIVDRCTTEFQAGLGVGVLMTAEITFNCTQAEYDSPMFKHSLADQEKILINEVVKARSVLIS
jgi:hypothetical protein